MASESVLERLEAEFDASPESIRAVIALFEDGAPPQFISRFRRDQTGDPGEERLCAIEERWHFLQDLETRKAAILQQAEAQNKVTPELVETLGNTHDQDLIDDIYQSFRPRRRTAGVQAEEKGLGPFAEAIHHRVLGSKSLQDAAAEYVSEERGLATPEDVLEGALYILAERYASAPKLRAQIREELSRGILKATAVAPDRKGAKRYQEFFAFEEPLRQINANRMLGLRRAEREGIIKVELTLPDEQVQSIFRKQFAADLEDGATLLPYLQLVFAHSYQHHVREACEADIRRRTKEKADRETVRGHARNLRSQLMAPPLGPKPAMIVRASTKTVWVVALNEDGSVNVQETWHLRAAKATAPTDGSSADESSTEPAATTPPTTEADDSAAVAETSSEAPAAEPETVEATDSAGPDSAETTVTEPAKSGEVAADAAAPKTKTKRAAKSRSKARKCTREEAIERLSELIEATKPAAVAIPHGRRQEPAQGIVAAAFARLSGVKKMVIPVDESLSAIYATSAAGRKALPSVEVGIRTSISLGRRLQDPLMELLAMNLREIGLGQNLAEVHQGVLNRQLDSAIACCLAQIGVDVNRAPMDMLARMPGIERDIARNIVEHRKKIGGFRKIEDLTGVSGINDRVFAHLSGFLRIEGGDEPLDTTPVHPESYELARQIAASRETPVDQLFGKSLRDVELDQFLSEDILRLRLLDVLHGLSSVGKDPRGVLAAWDNDDVKTIDDLAIDMQLRGRVTNLTDFGAFIDLGLGQDGLVHISQIPANRLRDPERTLRIGEVITVYVVNVDTAARRISLTMHKPRHIAEGRRPTLGERMQGRKGKPRGRGPRKTEAPTMSRAARAPEGRRGDRRGGPRRPGARTGPGGQRDGGGRGRDGGGRGGGGRGGGQPRVFTVESDRQVEESRGHKGELTSLEGLRNLLGGQGGGSDESGDAGKTEKQDS